MIKKIYLKNKRLFLILVIFLFLIFFLIAYFYSFGNKVSIVNSDKEYEYDLSDETNKENSNILNRITGEACDGGNKRPFAVMLAADKVARPLSGVSFADLVIEMPVITDGITRYMAFYACEEPDEIGSIRSARHDFITLAKAFDAIYVHWGGSSFALDRLKTGVIDNIDALSNPYNAFFRKNTKKAPHNGFTSYERLSVAADKLSYEEESSFEPYKYIKDKSKTKQNYEIRLGYPVPYNVVFRYNSKFNSYFRFVNSFKEIDSLNNKQVVVKNFIVMRANSKQIKDQYNDVDIESSGDATVYRNGEIIRAVWKLNNGKYIFLDESGKEIEFVPGKIWISILQPDQIVSIKNL